MHARTRPNMNQPVWPPSELSSATLNPPIFLHGPFSVVNVEIRRNARISVDGNTTLAIFIT